MNLTGIRNIIFDLGGVILNIDERKAEQAFRAFGMNDFDQRWHQLRQSRFFEDFETGKITAEGFRKEMKKRLPAAVTNSQIDEAWNAMLLNIPEERLRLLKELSTTYCLFLFSNTNEIHLSAFRKILGRDLGRNDLSHIFEREYYSNETGKRKPNKDAFGQILIDNNWDQEHTLFIDDTLEYAQAALKLGFKAYHLKEGEDITELFI